MGCRVIIQGLQILMSKNFNKNNKGQGGAAARARWSWEIQQLSTGGISIDQKDHLANVLLLK